MRTRFTWGRLTLSLTLLSLYLTSAGCDGDEPSPSAGTEMMELEAGEERPPVEPPLGPSFDQEPPPPPMVDQGPDETVRDASVLEDMGPDEPDLSPQPGGEPPPVEREARGLMDEQREAWRAEGLVEVEGNRFVVDGELYYPQTDFLTAVYPGDDWSSWSSLFYFGFDPNKRAIIRDALVEQGYNSIYLYTLNQGDGVITPYGDGGFSADVNALNEARVEEWRALTQELIDHRLKPFIWLAGDDSPAVAAMSYDDWRVYVDQMVELFEEFPVLWVIGLEVDEYWSPEVVEQRRAYLASRTQHPVGVHLTINETRDTSSPYLDNFDYVLGQLDSPQSSADYIRDTQAYAILDKPWIASEFNVFGQGEGAERLGSVTERSRVIGRAIASVGEPPLAAGIGNGIDLNRQSAPPPEQPPAGPPADFSGVIWLHTNVADWPEAATLSNVAIQGEQICLDYDRANEWPITLVGGSSGDVEVVSNPWVFIQHQGQWYAATWEWMRPGQICKAMSSVAGDHIKQSPFFELDWRPTPGQTYWFMVSAPARLGQMTVAERSNLLPLVWPGAPPPDGPPGGQDPGPNPPAGSEVIGYLDGVNPDGAGAIVTGWACHRGWAGSIEVHVYANGPVGGGGVELGSVLANQPSEPAVANACGSTGQAHRYRFQLSPEQLQNHAGQPLFVYGISRNETGNVSLTQSGDYQVP